MSEQKKNKCGAMDTQNCIYTTQGIIFCQREVENKNVPHFAEKVEFNYGMPFYQGNFLPTIEAFAEHDKRRR